MSMPRDAWIRQARAEFRALAADLRAAAAIPFNADREQYQATLSALVRRYRDQAAELAQVKDLPEEFPIDNGEGKDHCAICKGTKKGVPGNENLLTLPVCDYCHAELLDRRPKAT